jgi:hypothetical protein
MSASVSTQAATVARVATSTSAVPLLAAGAKRNMVLIVNESAAVLSIKFGATASATDYTVALAAGGYYEMPTPAYGGPISGILASGTGNAQVTSY